MIGGPPSPKIRLLPPEVAGRIAAGEVVERPASIVKELIDNSLDAGSRRILVEVVDGGRGLIRVSDDGEGMPREDAALAFHRHATSKLSSDAELPRIRTLGFRGEALPSIAAVAKVRLLTACRSSSIGTEVSITGGSPVRVRDAAAAAGTTVEVKDLFFNTPARKKFLKSASTEFAHLSQVVQQAALAWPVVQFGLRHNGRLVFDYPAVKGYRDRAFQIFGDGLIERMREVRAERPGYRLQGLVVAPEESRGARSPQELFVNARPVKNPTIAHAISDGYGASLAKGRYPLYILFLELDPERVDVNVHPTKREVRFAEHDVVHRLVRTAVREALGLAVAPASPAAGPEASRPVEPVLPGAAVPAPPAQPLLPLQAREDPPGYHSGPPTAPVEVEVIPLGQVHRTFLIAQVGAELQVIDQHTAHERVLFERLTRAWSARRMAVQPLLIPEPIELSPDRAAVLTEHLAALARLGLELEPFGGASFVIRGVPAPLGPIDHRGLLEDLLEELEQWGRRAVPSSLEERARPILASLACHGAVRAGRLMQLPEIKELVCDWVAEGLPPTCPHGRRVALRFPAEELAKIFGRV